MAVLYSDELQRSHYSPLLSKTTCMVYILLLISVLLPLGLVVGAHDFWVYEYDYFEQPNVQSMNEIIVVVYTDTQTYTFGSTKGLNDLFALDGDSVSAQISVENLDFNSDNKNEEVHIRVGTNIDQTQVKSVVVVQTLSYQISEQILATIKMPIFNIFNTPNGCKELNAVGTLELSQTSPFSQGAIERQMYYDFDLASHLKDQTFFRMFNDIQKHNVTGHYNVENQYITPARSIQAGEETKMDINLIMKIPQAQLIRAKMQLLESIKLSWIQYIYMFIPIFYIVYYYILGFSFKRNIMDTSTVSELSIIQKVKTANNTKVIR